jgi:hypothetical protein
MNRIKEESKPAPIRDYLDGVPGRNTQEQSRDRRVFGTLKVESKDRDQNLAPQTDKKSEGEKRDYTKAR